MRKKAKDGSIPIAQVVEVPEIITQVRVQQQQAEQGHLRIKREMV